MSNEIKHLYEFGEYRLNVREKNLWRGSELVQIPPKVFETLLLLVEKRGEIVSKDEMLGAVWQNSFVEESNISQNIYTLRQIFGSENKFIETVPKKGYRFAAPVNVSENENAEKFAGNGNGTFILAERTTNHTVEEEIYEDFSEKSFTRKTWLAVGVTAVCSVLLGFFGFYLFSGSAQGNSPASLENFEIKSLTDTGDVSSPVISPDGKTVAYLRKGKIYLKDIESGSDVEVRIENDLKPGFLRFAPDGKRIFFRNKGGIVSPQKIYEISYFGGEAKLFAEDVWGIFSFSPDGERIAFYRDKPAENKQFLIIKNLSDGEEKIVHESVFPQRMYLLVQPVWSPDGENIAFIPVGNTANRSQIAVLNLKTQNVVYINTELNKIRQFAWMPDGKNMIALVREEEKGWQMWQIAYPGGQVRRLTNDLNSYRGLSVSNDGRRIVSGNFSLVSNVQIFPGADRTRGKSLTSGDFGHYGLFDLQITSDGKVIFDARGKLKRELWLTNPADDSRVRLNENNEAFILNSAYSDGGKYIYYVSDRDKLKNIRRINANGENEVRITSVENQSSFAPAVSPDEKWLYFIRQTGNSTAIWRKSLTTNENEKFFESKDFTMGNFLAISPDGSYAAFYYIQSKKQANSLAEDDAGKIKIGFLNLADRREIKIREIDSESRFIVWTNGGRTFDYVQNTESGGRIQRLDFKDENKPPEVIFEMPFENIFRFAWSPDEKNLAVAHGVNRSDAVMLKIGKPE